MSTMWPSTSATDAAKPSSTSSASTRRLYRRQYRRVFGAAMMTSPGIHPYGDRAAHPLARNRQSPATRHLIVATLFQSSPYRASRRCVIALTFAAAIMSRSILPVANDRQCVDAAIGERLSTLIKRNNHRSSSRSSSRKRSANCLRHHHSP